MSGLETLGIILGAFLIAIEALEKYRSIAKIWNFWWQIRTQYNKYENALKFHKLYFENNIKMLILPLVADQKLIQKLLADPGGVEWREHGAAQLLKTDCKVLTAYTLTSLNS
jgi:hypothetical protein